MYIEVMKEQTNTIEKFDTVGFIMDYEGGNLTEEEIITGFQHLVDSGMAWSLQGSYGRMAASLIEAGLVTLHRAGTNNNE